MPDLEKNHTDLSLSREHAQALFDSLWRAGFRPQEWPDMDRLLAERRNIQAKLHKKFWDQFT